MASQILHREVKARLWCSYRAYIMLQRLRRLDTITSKDHCFDASDVKASLTFLSQVMRPNMMLLKTSLLWRPSISWIFPIRQMVGPEILSLSVRGVSIKPSSCWSPWFAMLLDLASKSIWTLKRAHQPKTNRVRPCRCTMICLWHTQLYISSGRRHSRLALGACWCKQIAGRPPCRHLRLRQ